jgi:hypothetical protein
VTSNLETPRYQKLGTHTAHQASLQAKSRPGYRGIFGPLGKKEHQTKAATQQGKHVRVILHDQLSSGYRSSVIVLILS